LAEPEKEEPVAVFITLTHETVCIHDVVVQTVAGRQAENALGVLEDTVPFAA
jgi:hypothetical protein